MSQPNFAQNPEELFDVLTADGQPTGIVKARKDVHRDGDWHRCIHVWVYGVEGGRTFLLLNKRGLDKDTWPGVLDATVGGHLSAGETVADAYREVQEEIGIEAEPSKLLFVGTRPRSGESHPGVIDRELQEVFLYRDDRPLTGYQPNPAELEGLIRVDLQDAIALFAAERTSIPGQFLSAKDSSLTPLDITDQDLLPYRIDQYFLRIAIAIQRVLRGDHHILA